MNLPSHPELAKLLGRRVRVSLTEPGAAGQVVAEGTFIGFGDGGDVELREDDGFIHHCWPMLSVEEVE